MTRSHAPRLVRKIASGLALAVPLLAALPAAAEPQTVLPPSRSAALAASTSGQTDSRTSPSSRSSDPLPKILGWLLLLACGGGGAATTGAAKKNDQK